jgi:1,4-dihydroxy-2-naphthoate octaprenyltransferase
MWAKALSGMPRIDGPTWHSLDLFSRWLIATRAAVLVMTFTSAALAGLFAFKAGEFQFIPWLMVTLGLCLAHATNNLLNDLTDHWKGVDKGNYFRTRYGVQPIESGLMTVRQNLMYTAVTGGLAVLCGIYLWTVRGDTVIWLTAIGAFFVLFYTWPLKYYGMGEPAVLLVWGPLMVGGSYYVLAGSWSWSVTWLSLVFALGPTTVLFGKHTDKLKADRSKGVNTLPVLLGEGLSRYCVLAMIGGQYMLCIALVLAGSFGWPLLLVLISLPAVPGLFTVYGKPKPAAPPENYPEAVWPLWFSAYAFGHTRRFTSLFLLGVIVDTVLA